MSTLGSPSGPQLDTIDSGPYNNIVATIKLYLMWSERESITRSIFMVGEILIQWTN